MVDCRDVLKTKSLVGRGGGLWTVLLVIAVLLPLPFSMCYASDEAGLLGDGNDGNRSSYVHLIQLYDKNGATIRAKDKKPEPFSTRRTCGECHNYDVISAGWHFHGGAAAADAGRKGEPLIIYDNGTRTVLPVSSRGWEGSLTPEQLGVTPWQYTKLFGIFMPGGGFGEAQAGDEDPEAMLRGEISGKFEINCLACHNAGSEQDQNLAALLAARQNYQWLATGASGLGVVTGTASALDDFFDPLVDEGVSVTYDTGRFNEKDEVHFDLTADVPAKRCYFCHSTQDLDVSGADEWHRDEDIHISSGMNCVDCHRNGDDHMIVRGYEGQASLSEEQTSTLTCSGCHIGHEDSEKPMEGRLGAPNPKHAGIPTIHFDKLTCTACHTGPWPKDEAGFVKTSRIHRIGLHGKHSIDVKIPNVQVVLAKGEDGKIGPHKIFWPAYWCSIEEDKITPILPDQVESAAGRELGVNLKGAEEFNGWRALTFETIGQALKKLDGGKDGPAAGYICGGKLYRLNDAGEVISADHTAAKPYMWPMAHDVRGASQSLGVRNCKDCHTTDSNFFFATAKIDTPVPDAAGVVKMVQLEELNELLTWAFAFSFVFRPWLKLTIICACGLIAAVIVLYGLKALGCIAKSAAQEE